MSLKDKMANAKEVDLFEDLTQEEKIEAIVEGRLQVAMIRELEKIKAEILSECPNTNARMICISILYKHISELKGENK